MLCIGLFNNKINQIQTKNKLKLKLKLKNNNYEKSSKKRLVYVTSTNNF
jgi:hypothetical protein